MALLSGLLLLAAGTAAAEPKVRSLDIRLTEPADLPVVRSLMRTVVGRSYDPKQVAGDLYRLGVLGYALTRFEAQFEADGVALSVSASQAKRPARPHLSALDLVGGAPAVDRKCRPLLSLRAATLFRKRTLDLHAMLEDVRVIRRTYRALGHLDARVTRLALRVDKGGRARITIHIKPGKLFTPGPVTVEGNRGIERAELLAALAIRRDLPWTRPRRDEAVRRARLFCREQGYRESRIKLIETGRKAATVGLRLELTEGDRAVLNHVVVRGAGKHKDAVAGLITLRKGQPVRQSEIDALRRAIDDLGLFTHIDLLFVPLRDRPAGRRDLVIRVTPVNIGRQVGPGERLYYRMAKAIIRLHNRGAAGVRALKLRGFVTLAGRKLTVDAAFVRPDAARVELTVAGPDGAPAQRFALWRKGRRTAVFLAPLGRTLELPEELAVGVRFAVRPPDLELDLPSQLELGAAIEEHWTGSDVLRLGERCPPVSAYFTRLAKSFARVPPTLDGERTLVLPAASEQDQTVRVLLGPDDLPRRITRLDAGGKVTAQIEIEINPRIPPAELTFPPGPLADDARATGAALAVPALTALGLPEVAERFADRAVARAPHSPECLAVRGLVRLVMAPPDPGLADLRAAADRSRHPAYHLLLAETLIRGERWNEARTVCERLLKADLPRGAKVDPADLILASSLSLRSAAQVLLRGPGDHARRARIDAALAHVGLGEYQQAAGQARTVLRTAPNDAHAAELLARCELGLGRPEPALAALAKIPPDRRKTEHDLYTALAHQMLGKHDPAVEALRAAVGRTPGLRNLYRLLDRAAGIHPSFKEPAAKAALAKSFRRAADGVLIERPAGKVAAVVNDAHVLRSQVETALRLTGRDDKKTRAAVLEQLIEDTLIAGWAAAHGASLGPDELAQAIDAEMKRLGADDLDAYRKRLAARGTTLADRRRAIAIRLLKRQAFAYLLSDRVLVRPADIRGHYARNRSEFDCPPTARFRMISLRFDRFPAPDRARRIARALLDQLKKKPEAIAELAREFSHDANAARGGLWANVSEGSLVAALDKAVFGTKPGRLSGVIETGKGCHILRVEDLRPQRALSLEEAAPGIARKLQTERARRVIAAWLQQLRAASHVQVLDGP